MKVSDLQTDTICAPATPTGGALAVLRVSGPEALKAVDNIFSHDLVSRPGGSLTFGTLRDGVEPLDEVVVAVYRAPHSFTGEDSVEISCHGSLYIVRRLLALLQQQGCRAARPGEFTQRAFLNGKMDLTRAEAVADIISASTKAAHRMAMSQMRGHFSQRLGQLRERLLQLCSLLELELDFSDHEDLTFASRDDLQALMTGAIEEIDKLAGSFALGNVLKQGIPVAIVGQPNVGKSTLLNALLGEDRAIVSDVRGTTRDAIEDTVNIGGTLFRFIDTAGLRRTTDTVEQLGIARTLAKLQDATVVLWVLDALLLRTDFEALAPSLLPRVEGKQLILVVNKCDLAMDTAMATKKVEEQLQNLLAACPEETHHVLVSAKAGAGLPELTAKLVQITSMPATASGSDVIVSNARHHEALLSAADALRRAIQSLRLGLTVDLVSEDLREAIRHLSEITGDITSQDILNRVFSKFCIGK